MLTFKFGPRAHDPISIIDSDTGYDLSKVIEIKSIAISLDAEGQTEATVVLRSGSVKVECKVNDDGVRIVPSSFVQP